MMPAPTPTAFSRVRLLRHPGPVDPVRINSKNQQNARHIRLLLPPGLSLYDAVVATLARVGVTSASMTILGGAFEQLRYCIASANPRGKALAAYSTPIDAGAAFLIFGNATLGTGADGAPLVHCHASIRDGNGNVCGGHILPEQSIVGASPVSALVTALEGFELRQVFDEETNMPLFKPRSETPHA